MSANKIEFIIDEEQELIDIIEEEKKLAEKKRQIILKKQISNPEFQKKFILWEKERLLIDIKDRNTDIELCNKDIKSIKKTIQELEDKVERLEKEINELEDDKINIEGKIEEIEGIDFDTDDVETYIMEMEDYEEKIDYYNEEKEKEEKKQQEKKKLQEEKKSVVVSNPKKASKQKKVVKVNDTDDLFKKLDIYDEVESNVSDKVEVEKPKKARLDRVAHFNALPIGLNLTIKHKGNSAEFVKTENGIERDGKVFTTLNSAGRAFYGEIGGRWRDGQNGWVEFKTMYDGKMIDLATYVVKTGISQL